MEMTEAEKRKIRRQIRKQAKLMGISTKEYKALQSEPDEFESKPFDPLSNKPKFATLQIDRPKYIVMHDSFYDINHVMKLAENGHYLTFKKYNSAQPGGLVKVGENG